jgi:hypothetical protein
VETNSTGGQGSRWAVAPSDDDNDETRKLTQIRAVNTKRLGYENR